ncbi:unnamed protein product [Mytilus edulis]|uniref:SRCR domain-containing protein n=1 Tax=Mytilus edulis TaxID=6550 RepID=A0A8S3SGC7_MYTED|nr:unnamed protein product [Mytilus edulis]
MVYIKTSEDFSIGVLWIGDPPDYSWADGKTFDHWENFQSDVSPSKSDDMVYVDYTTGKWNFDMGSHGHIAACDYTIGEQTDRHYALVGGNIMCGRLEVFHDGFWGTIYDPTPDIELGYLLCNRLGYEFVAFDSSCVSKVGTGLIWSIDAVCDSNATTIDDCFPGQTTWDTSVTDHTHDVYVRCKEKVITTRKPTTTVTTKATTSGSTTEESTSGSTTEESTSGPTTEESTSGSTTEETTSGSTTEETTSGSTTEESTSGSTTEESTSVSTTEETKTSTESMLYPSTTEYCLTNCDVIHTVTETVTMTQNVTVTATATVNITITTSGK